MDNQVQRKSVLVAGLVVAMLFAALDSTIVGTAMPRIVGELGGLEMMTWLTTAYMLSSTAVVLIAGKLSDLIGRKPVYMAGIAIFILGSVLCGAAQSMTQLVWFRGFQGIGGGVMMPMAMIIVGDIFTGEQRAKWQGVFGGIFGLSSVVGPQIGGWIVDVMNWRWVFYINLPVGFVAMLLIAIGLNRHRVTGPVKIDFGGMATMVVGIASLLLALTFGGKQYAWMSWQITALFFVAAVSLIGFGWIESRVSEPILPLRLFKNKTFSLLSGIGFLMSAGMFGAMMFVPLYMQGVIGVSASTSGTVMTPMMLSMILTSIIGSRVVKYVGIRPQMMFGMAMIALGFWFLSTMNMDTSRWTSMSYMAVMGLGIGLVMPLITVALQQTFSKSELGVVTSSSQFFRQVGGTFGMTILGVFMNHSSTQLLTQKLVPSLERLPAEASPFVGRLEYMIQHDAQGLYSMLLSPEALNRIPSAIQKFMIPILKNTLVESLHGVFLLGLLFAAVGLLLTPFLGKIKWIPVENKSPD